MSAKYDFTTLKMREIAEIERRSGQGLATFADNDAHKALLLTAIAYVFKHRDDEAFTWDQAQDLTLAEITEINGALSDLTISDGTEESDAAQ